jgi:hypothetical protein
MDNRDTGARLGNTETDTIADELKWFLAGPNRGLNVT